MKKVLITVAALLVPCNLAAKILAFFSTPVPSHHFFFQPILHALAERGHHVDYYTTIPMKAPHSNTTEFVFEDFYSKEMAKFSFGEQWKLSTIQQMTSLWEMFLNVEMKLCQTETLHRLVTSNRTYDLLIHEGFVGAETSNVLIHKFNVPSVGLLSLGDMINVNVFSGLVNNPSYMVSAFTVHTEHMGFLERLNNVYLSAGSLYTYFKYLKELQSAHDQFLTYPGWESRPSLTSLMSNQSLILVNSHHSVGYAYPMAPHVKEIGGSILSTNKPLPPDILKFMDGAEHGVIYLSMGTRSVLETSKTNAKKIFLKVFSRRKERILWKSNGIHEVELPANIMMSKWFPQQDILAHKNTKLFVTHGGLQSFFETVTFGVPVVVIPSFGDQNKNSLAIVHHGYGVRLTLDNITEVSLSWALDEVLSQSKYKSNIRRGSTVLNDRPMSPVDEGVYWIEYVLRHGSVLQPEGARLGFIQLHCLDVYSFILAVSLVILYLAKLIFSRMCNVLRKVKTVKIINFDVTLKKQQ